MNLIPIQFINVFKKIFCLYYFKHFPGANCIEILNKILTQINDSQTSSDIHEVLLNTTQDIFNLNPLNLVQLT